MKPFFLGRVGERESDIACVGVLRRRIAKRGENFISSGPLTYSLVVREDDRDRVEGCGGMGSGTTV